MTRRLARASRSEVLIDSQYSSGGRKRNNTTSGGRATIPTPGTKPTPTPRPSCTSGGGRCSQRAPTPPSSTRTPTRTTTSSACTRRSSRPATSGGIPREPGRSARGSLLRGAAVLVDDDLLALHLPAHRLLALDHLGAQTHPLGGDHLDAHHRTLGVQDDLVRQTARTRRRHPGGRRLRLHERLARPLVGGIHGYLLHPDLLAPNGDGDLHLLGHHVLDQPGAGGGHPLGAHPELLLAPRHRAVGGGGRGRCLGGGRRRSRRRRRRWRHGRDPLGRSGCQVGVRLLLDALLLDALPLDALPLNALPLNALPLNALPLDALPLGSPLLDPVVTAELGLLRGVEVV